MGNLAFMLAEYKKAPSKAKAISQYLDSLPSLAEYREQGLPLAAPEADLEILAKLPRLSSIPVKVKDTKAALKQALILYNKTNMKSGSATPLEWEDALWALMVV